MAEMTPILLSTHNKKPMAIEPIYLSSDGSDYSTLNTTLDQHHESFYSDSFNQLLASHLGQISNMGTETIFYPPTPNTSKISADEEQQNLSPIIGNPEQYTSHNPQR